MMDYFDKEYVKMVMELEMVGYKNVLSLIDGKPYFRYDVDEYSQDPQEEYDSIMEAIARLGYELNDPYIEHDCITGDLVLKPSELVRIGIQHVIVKYGDYFVLEHKNGTKLYNSMDFNEVAAQFNIEERKRNG